jgi:hypothetical protein
MLAQNGEDQLWWLLQNHLQDFTDHSAILKTLSKDEVFDIMATNQVMAPDSLQQYRQSLDTIKHDFPKACNGLMANYLLYQGVNLDLVSDKKLVKTLEKQAAYGIILECQDVNVYKI